MYRFEKGDRAAGLIYNADGADSKKWIDEIKELNSATMGLEASSLAATAFSCLTYLMLR